MKRVRRAVRKAGYPVVLTERMGLATNCRMWAPQSPAPIIRHVLNPNCRSHDVSDLFVVDSSLFPSSAALNPALTIAANALGRADHRDQHSKLDVASLDERRRGARSGTPDSTGEFRVAEGMGATGVDEKDAAVG